MNNIEEMHNTIGVKFGGLIVRTGTLNTFIMAREGFYTIAEFNSEDLFTKGITVAKNTGPSSSRYGVIDNQGEFIVPMVHDSVWILNDDIILLLTNGELTAQTREGDVLVVDEHYAGHNIANFYVVHHGDKLFFKHGCYSGYMSDFESTVTLSDDIHPALVEIYTNIIEPYKKLGFK
jgi:hypothetical protein